MPRVNMRQFLLHISRLDEAQLLCLEAKLAEEVDSGIEMLSYIDDRLLFLEEINYKNITDAGKK